jgi:hypothetical protein
MLEKLPKLSELFPFTYVGGGHFRENGVPPGESAKTLHGSQVPEFIYEALLALERPSVSIGGVICSSTRVGHLGGAGTLSMLTHLRGKLWNGAGDPGNFDLSIPAPSAYSIGKIPSDKARMTMTISWEKPE